MANQAPDRRQMLDLLAKAAVASQFPGFTRWVFAGDHEHAMSTPASPKPEHYQPQFFSADEYRKIDVLTELIIPRDETPGASEAGVSEFIDFMAAHGEEQLQPLRPGLQWLDNKAKSVHGRGFLELPPDQQTALLKNISRSDAAGDDARGRKFFLLIRRYTVMGYYTSKVGLEELDFPGLRLYTQSPACPHRDDPEHKHLPPPRF
jgi:gluconate 2-dehydrogenase subunit 3-like protein